MSYRPPSPPYEAKPRKCKTAAPAAAAAASTASQVAKTAKKSKEEKRQERRKQHCDIERKRRLRINDQFNKLRDLVPACQGFKEASGGDVGLHKLSILENTVTYTAALQDIIHQHGLKLPDITFEGDAPAQCFSTPPYSPTESDILKTAAAAPVTPPSSEELQPQRDLCDPPSPQDLSGARNRMSISNLLS